jgi:hypothetical protein
MATELRKIPERVDITVWRGNSLAFNVNVTDSGSPLPVAGASATLELQDMAGQAVSTLTPGSGLTLSLGVIAVEFSEAAITALPYERELKYHLKFTSASGDKSTFIYGLFSIPDGITPP